jgi:hypothetical protein
MPFVNSMMVGSIIDKEPENTDVPFYSQDKDSVLPSPSRISFTKRERFERLPKYKDYILRT